MNFFYKKFSKNTWQNFNGAIFNVYAPKTAYVKPYMKIFSECLLLIPLSQFPKLFLPISHRPFSASCLSLSRLIFLKNYIIIVKKTFSSPRASLKFVKNLTKYFRQTPLRITTDKTFPNLVKILTIFPQPFPRIKKQETKKKDAARLNLTTSLTILLTLFSCNSYLIRLFPLVVCFNYNYKHSK